MEEKDKEESNTEIINVQERNGGGFLAISVLVIVIALILFFLFRDRLGDSDNSSEQQIDSSVQIQQP